MSAPAAPYTPNPGSTPDRVLAHLHTLPRGAEASTASIADSLGILGAVLTSAISRPRSGSAAWRC